MLTDEAKKFLIKKGSNLDFGARPLRRAIENFVEDPLSEELLKGEFKGMDAIRIEVKEVGDKKQLIFVGSHEEAAQATPAKETTQPPTVGAAPARPARRPRPAERRIDRLFLWNVPSRVAALEREWPTLFAAQEAVKLIYPATRGQSADLAVQ